MRSPRRVLSVAVLTTLALASPLVTTALGKLPSATTGSATTTTHHSAVLTGTVVVEAKTTDYEFEYGTTTAYGQSTAPMTLTGDHVSRPVTAAIDGLAPSTTYHFRVKATNKEGVASGADRSFTTAPAPASNGATAGGGDSTGGTAGGGETTQDAQPTLGTAVVVAPAAGTVAVKAPGAAAFVALREGDAIPVGSLVDTRAGTVSLTSALGDGTTQTGRFHGALFRVQQSPSAHGLTDIVLRGGNFASCRRTAAHAAATRRPPVRRLWGHDDGGRFRTHGRDSVATVRGTSWVMTDTCAGTRTRVTQGAVSVRDLHRHRTVLVHAGESYLARAR